MQSASFQLLHRAILDRKQVVCMQGGYRRAICPHILGHKNGREVLLAFQFGGESSSKLPPGGQWRCFSVDDLNFVSLQDGPWHSGNAHKTVQTCVDEVYVDVNADVPDQPGRM